MSKFVQEVKHDLNFLKTHTLQPKWYKLFKVFILLGFLAGYYFLFRLVATLLFMITFLCLMLAVHLTYRVKTNKYTRNWLDFKVVAEPGAITKPGIGKYYYPAIIVNLILAIIVSQLLT